MDPSQLTRAELRSFPVRRIRASLIILVSLITIGTLGFYLLAGYPIFECLYLTVVIVTTVGMKEERLRMGPAEEAWAMFLMLAGISTALYATSTMVAFMVEGELRRLFGRRKMQNRIANLKGHYIVCGFGRMGRALCASLQAKGAQFVLLELDEQILAEADRLGYLSMIGDAMSEESLKAAGIDRAKGLVTCLHSDADNVFVTLTGRGLNPKLLIVARAEQPATEPKLLRAGADRVVVPPVIGANKVTQMLLTPAVDELVELAVGNAELEVSKVSIAELPGLAGRSLRELELPTKAGMTVVAVLRPDGQRLLNPPGPTILQNGDELILMGSAGGVTKLAKLLEDLAANRLPTTS